jgi:hypothetical protein
MPTISEFFGIAIYMYYSHGKHKAPYFHTVYQGEDASFSIETGEILAGRLSKRVAKLIQEWAERHREEPMADWELVKKTPGAQVDRGGRQ